MSRLADMGVVHQEAVMGTVFTFDVCTPASASTLEAALAEAVEWLGWVDRTFSTYKPDSEVCRFDRGELPAGQCCPQMREVMALCRRFNEETEGFFDAWAGASFDPSGVVKGWSIDRASAILTAHGLADHMVDGGGDIVVRGSPRPEEPGPPRPWLIAVRHPLDKAAYSAALSVAAGAVATSGTYERGLHVLDPFTGRPAGELASVTVVGPEITAADAYATAALAMGHRAPAWLARLQGYEAQVVTPEGKGWSTPGFAALALAVPAGPPSAD